MAAVTGEAMAFQYAVLRAVPRIDRGEFVNIGVIVYCQQADFLRCAVAVDPERLQALDPAVDLEAVRTAADAVVDGCAIEVGSARQNDGLATRFGMLTAPRSTVVQPSPIHAGVTSDPARTLSELVTKLVEPPRRPVVTGTATDR